MRNKVRPDELAELRENFRTDGAVLVKNCLSAADLARCQQVFDWAVAHPGPLASQPFEGAARQTLNDHANPNIKRMLDDLMATLPFTQLLTGLLNTRNLWYFSEEVFLKAGGASGRTPWHQDTSYLPWGGTQWVNAWVSFQPVPKRCALEMVRGSHRGTLYDGTSFANPDDPTEPLHGGDMPRLPDIEAERAVDPDAWDIFSFATEPGDVVLLHPGTLHGGAPVDADFPVRHTLVFRFFGDDATFRPLPDGDSIYSRNGRIYVDEMEKMAPGAPFRSPIFRQLA